MKKLGKEFEGFTVSEATLRTEDLLASFIQFINNLVEGKKIIGNEVDAEDVRSLLDEHQSILDGMHDTGEYNDDVDVFLNEDVYDFLNKIAPENCYFGAHEGDGACFGFWLIPDDFDGLCQDCGEEIDPGREHVCNDYPGDDDEEDVKFITLESVSISINCEDSEVFSIKEYQDHENPLEALFKGVQDFIDDLKKRAL